MKRILYLLLGAVIFTTACQTNTELTLTDADKNVIVETIKQTSDEFWSLWKEPYDSVYAENILKFMNQNFAETWQSEAVFASQGINLVKSLEDYQNSWETAITRRISTSFSNFESYYSVLSKNKVLEVTKEDYFVTRLDSTVGPLYNGITTIIWGRVDGEWKVQYMHLSWGRKPE